MQSTSTGPLFVSNVVSATLEGLGPELRDILLKNISVSRSPRCFDETDEENHAAVVATFVQHVLNQPVIPGQQEATLTAAQRLEATELHMNERLHSEVVFCHEQLLSTIASSENLHGELMSLASNVSSLQSVTARMKLCIAVPLTQLRWNASAMKRYTKALVFVTTFKRLAQLAKIFEAQYGELLNFEAHTTTLDDFNNYIAFDLPKAALAQLEIEHVLDRLAYSCKHKENGDNEFESNYFDTEGKITEKPYNRLNRDQRNSILLNNFPILKQDLALISNRTDIIRTFGVSMLKKGIELSDRPQVLASLETLLFYGGLPLAVAAVRAILNTFIEETTFNSESIIPWLKTPQYSLRPLKVASSSSNTKSTSSSEAIQALNSSLNSFLDTLVYNTKRTLTLSSTLVTLGRNVEVMSHIGFLQHPSSFRKMFALQLGYMTTNTNKAPLDDIPLILWNQCIEQFGITISRLTATTSSFHSLLVERCPLILERIMEATRELSAAWMTHYHQIYVCQYDHRHFVSSNFNIPNFDEYPASDRLVAVFDPFFDAYIQEARNALISPVTLMFPTLNHSINNISSSNIAQSTLKTVPLPTSTDIKTFVATISTQLTDAAPASSIYSEVLKAVEEAIDLCSTNIRRLRDSAALTLPLAITHGGELITSLPTVTAGHRRNSKLHEICYLLHTSLTNLFTGGSVTTVTNSSGNRSLIEFLDIYEPLQGVMLTLECLKESLVIGWFLATEEYINNQLYLLPAAMTAILPSSPEKRDETKPNQMQLGAEIMQRISFTCGFIYREFFSLVIPAAAGDYGTQTARACTHTYLAAVCLIKPLQEGPQCHALVSHTNKFQNILTNFFCPTLSETLSVEHLMLRSLARLLLLDTEYHITFTSDGTKTLSVSSEFTNIVQLLPRHLIWLHLYARLPQLPTLPDYLDMSTSNTVSQLARSLTDTHQTSAANELLRPSKVQHTIETLVNKEVSLPWVQNNKRNLSIIQYLLNDKTALTQKTEDTIF